MCPPNAQVWGDFIPYYGLERNLLLCLCRHYVVKTYRRDFSVPH